jgi:hypothetical protein
MAAVARAAAESASRVVAAGSVFPVAVSDSPVAVAGKAEDIRAAAGTMVGANA